MINQTIQSPIVANAMNDTTLYLNENLRSISAIVAARNRQEDLKQPSIFEEYDRQSKASKQSVNVIKIHRSSSPSNYNSTKDTLQQNNSALTKAKTHLWRTSKVVPYNNNVFYFDDGDDSTMTNVSFNRYGPTKEDRRNATKIIAKRRCKCISIFICIFAILIFGISSAIVLASLLIPPETKPTQDN